MIMTIVKVKQNRAFPAAIQKNVHGDKRLRILLVVPRWYYEVELRLSH